MATRRERVVIDLEDNFSTGMALAAAKTAVLSRELKNLDGKSVGRDLEQTAKSADKLGTSFRRSGADIDSYSGRLGLLRDTSAILGPALIATTAAGIPAIAGLTVGLGAAAVAGGTALLAFQGVGDTLKAVNAAALEPTTENLAKAQEALAQLSPAAQDLVTQLNQLQPTLKGLEAASATGFFPGLSASIDELATAGPRVEQVLFQIGTVMGNLAKQGADALTGAGFAGFFDYVQHDAPIALAQLATAVGHVTHGLAELVTAVAPLSRDFASGLVDAANAFDEFASGVSKTQGFGDFIEYVQTEGPKVGEAVGAIANALIQVARAASGFGGPVLQSITALADVVAKLADSKAGPALVALAGSLALVNRAMAASNAIKGSALFTKLGAAKTAASEVETFGGKLASVTSTLGPWGLAVGAGAGLLLHFAGSQHQAVVDTGALTGTLDQQTGAVTKNTAAYVAQQFATSGILQTAKSLGLSLSDVTDAALGNQDALTRVNTALAGYTSQQTAAATAGRGASVSGVGSNQALADSAKKVSDAINGTSSALTNGRNQLSLIAGATKGAAGSFDLATSAAQSFQQQMTSLSDFLQGRASFRDYRASLDDFTQSLKTNGKNLDVNTAKGRANQAALDNIASTASKVASSLTGVDRADFLIKARAAFVDAAKKAGLTRQAAKGLADQLYDTGGITASPKVQLNAAAADRGLDNLHQDLEALDLTTASPKVTAQTDQAQAAISHVLGLLGAVHSKAITVTTTNVVHNIGSTGNPQARASGGWVRGPGSTTSDSIPALLSDREYVMPAAAVDHYGLGFMELIRARAFASGGLATASGEETVQPHNRAKLSGLLATLVSARTELVAA